MIPSGAIGACGSSPSTLATSLLGTAEMFRPSSSTAPRRAGSSRARPRSRVDLPQPLAPMMTLIRPVGISQRQVVDTIGPVPVRQVEVGCRQGVLRRRAFR